MLPFEERLHVHEKPYAVEPDFFCPNYRSGSFSHRLGPPKGGKIVDGEREGPWVTYDAWGRRANGSYKAGVEVGKWSFFYWGERKRAEGSFAGSRVMSIFETKALVPGTRIPLRTGMWTYYHRTGNKEASGRYVRDRKEGEWSYWFPSGKLRAKGRLRRGYRRGQWQSWYENGRLRTRGAFSSGGRTGRWEEWYENGARRSSGDYLVDCRQDEWTFWHPNGRKAATGSYRLHQRTGRWIFRDKDGVPDLKQSGTYEKGRLKSAVR